MKAIKRDLTTKQQLWLDYFFGEAAFNATEAARKAGYRAKTDTAFRVIGTENLAKLSGTPGYKAKLETVTVSALEVKANLADIARSDLGDFIDDEGYPDWKKAKQSGKTHLLKRWKHKSRKIPTGEGQFVIETETEIELIDKFAALTLLARMHGMLTSVTDEGEEIETIKVIIVHQNSSSRTEPQTEKEA